MVNKTYVFAIAFFLVCLTFQYSYCTNTTNTESLYKMLLDGYSKDIIAQDIVILNTFVVLVGINKFDELNGDIEMTCLFDMKWHDDRLTWTPSEYGGKTSLQIPVARIWHPMLYLIQSVETIQVIGSISELVRIYSNGTVSWLSPNVLKVMCSVDVTYYPFDTQVFFMSVSPWAYTKEEMIFVITQKELELSSVYSNSQWDFVSGSVYPSTTPHQADVIDIQITLRRKSDFYVVYIISPLIFLGCINNLVFVMPASSGERTSVAITVFLSFVVFMEMVNAHVPESSSPLAYIYYYMLFLLTYSSTALFLCIMSLRIFDKDGPVPPKVVQLVKYLRFWRLKCRKQNVSPTDDAEGENEHDYPQKAKLEHTDIVLGDTNEVTWKIVGKTFDKYCFSVLSFVYVIYTVITFARLYSNIGL